MHISRIQIQNFRNFATLDLHLAGNTVIVGENKIGKTNLLHAMRLVLDPSLPDSARQLRDEDFWDGLPRPLTRADKIKIAIDLTEFEDDENQVALLAEHLVEPEPMTARLTYMFQPLETLDGEPAKESDYEFFLYGGDKPETHLAFELRRRLPVDLLPALRDAEGDIANWRRSPLRPLVDDVASRLSREQLISLAEGITSATVTVAENEEVKGLVDKLNTRIQQMVGSTHSVDATLGFSPTDPEKLMRALRIFIDGGKRDIGAASLGSANVLYLTLKALALDLAVSEGQRNHTFLGIEEPEAHLHPHLQRLVYRDLLRSPGGTEASPSSTLLLTTHSPHIVSVAPLRSIALLRKRQDGRATEGVSTAKLTLEDGVIADLERYLDVTRGELFFAKGVILVEGEAERFLIPALAKTNGVDFDALGISVCSVAGTNFLPYLSLLGSNGLNVPVAVVTDGDPSAGARRGEKRILDLLSAVTPADALRGLNDATKLTLARDHGLFVGDHTLEVDLLNAGGRADVCETLIELAPGNTARTRARQWQSEANAVDPDQLIADIETIGKGRFAQRLSTRIQHGLAPYIAAAIEYVAQRAR